MAAFKSTSARNDFIFWGTLATFAVPGIVLGALTGWAEVFLALGCYLLGMVGLGAACWFTRGEDDLS
ncbi:MULTISPECIES: hypothetical protein [Chelatococcus]|uniref:Uncharacterized protein n=1 Tax=Chelatococcus caeni TaxID=1348468 RepID=A0A840BXB3_9HYPH|nr:MULTISPECIES: hypothetical protein [Chelatococcus]ALA16102.1 hypothetical protein AL346_00200 [Chelatococcus sp. CO-6]MBB4017610.1 hypothetical protein [Chelatococcus caeni]